MTKKTLHPTIRDNRSTKRVLKPAVEKKRRDRINQSLGDLKTLLMYYTSDARLQNPKVEKAEILDLAVSYLKQKTERQTKSKDSLLIKEKTDWSEAQIAFSGVLHQPSDPSPPVLSPIQTAGFRQCVSQLAGFMSRAMPADRESFIEGLKSYLNKHLATVAPGQTQFVSITNPHLRMTGKEIDKRQNVSSVNEACCHPKQKAAQLFAHDPSCQQSQQSLPSSTDYPSPPPSPCLSCCSSASPTPPSFPSFPCHFQFPPSLSPLSPHTSCSHPSSTHIVPAALSPSPMIPVSSPHALHCSPRRSSDPTPRQGLPANYNSFTWRPWF